MRAHIIEGGAVANTIAIEALDSLPGVTLIDADLHGGTIGWQWDGESLTPPPVDLAALKSAKNAGINAARLEANFSTFTHSGKTFACDQLSRSDIDGTNGFVSLYGSMPPGWTGGWKAVDNTYTPIATVNDWKAFYASLFAAGNANFAHAQALKAALSNATTAEQVAAIHWGMQP